LYEKGAYVFDEKSEKLSIDYSKINEVLISLATELLMIEATGDYQGSKDIIAKYIVMSDVMSKLIAKLSEIPVDIKPIFQIEQN